MNSLSRRTLLQGAGALITPPLVKSGSTQNAQQVVVPGAPAQVPQGAAQTARGFVFLDANKTGKRAPNSKGLAGGRVSNGREVVVTDAQGRYQLPLGDEGAIFVVKPSGYRVPLNAQNLP